MTDTVGHYMVHHKLESDVAEAVAVPASRTPLLVTGAVHREFARKIERERNEARDKLAEAERELAWLRSGGNKNLDLRLVENGLTFDAVAVRDHLASSPPKDWMP